MHPLFFIMYYNLLMTSLLFLRMIILIIILLDKINEELNKLVDWFDANKLSISCDKTKCYVLP